VTKIFFRIVLLYVCQDGDLFEARNCGNSCIRDGAVPRILCAWTAYFGLISMEKMHVVVSHCSYYLNRYWVPWFTETYRFRFSLQIMHLIGPIRHNYIRFNYILRFCFLAVWFHPLFLVQVYSKVWLSLIEECPYFDVQTGNRWTFLELTMVQVGDFLFVHRKLLLQLYITLMLCCFQHHDRCYL
jgi:hypothetical protein